MLNKLADIESRKAGTRPTTTHNNFFCSNTTQATSKGTTSSQFNYGHNNKAADREQVN